MVCLRKLLGLEPGEGKGLSSSVFAVLASVSLVSAMFLLSASTESSGQDNLLQDGFSLGNKSQELAEKGLREAARRKEGLPENISAEDLNAKGFNKSDLPDNVSEADVNSSQLLNRSEEFNLSESGNSSLSNGSDSFNSGMNDSRPETGSENVSESISSGESSQEGVAGLVENISKAFAESLEGSLTGSRQDKEGSREKKSSKRGKDGKAGNGKRLEGLLPDLGVLPYLAGLIGVVLLVLVLNRLRKGDSFLQAFLNGLKEFVVSLPDLFRRAVVRLVEALVSTVYSFFEKLKFLVRSPTLFFRRMMDTWRTRFQRVEKEAELIREEGLIKRFTGSDSGELEGIEKVWMELKNRLGLDSTTGLTPEEIRERAKEELPAKSVDRIVEAFKKEKYSSDGYSGDLEVENWLEEVKEEDE
ncbi:MAG: hypothetical protein ABEJ93_00130 [Candidatus Nanohalobium sp.]